MVTEVVILVRVWSQGMNARKVVANLDLDGGCDDDDDFIDFDNTKSIDHKSRRVKMEVKGLRREDIKVAKEAMEQVTTYTDFGYGIIYNCYKLFFEYDVDTIVADILDVGGIEKSKSDVKVVAQRFTYHDEFTLSFSPEGFDQPKSHNGKGIAGFDFIDDDDRLDQPADIGKCIAIEPVSTSSDLHDATKPASAVDKIFAQGHNVKHCNRVRKE
ncbi:hypothetical protein Tco_0274020 [Tanacetum coccineum]